MALHRVKTGCIYAAVGATVGLGIGLYREASKTGPPEWAKRYAHLRGDNDALYVCEQLLAVTGYTDGFEAYVNGLDRMLALAERAEDGGTPVRISLPAVAQLHRRQAVDGLRALGDRHGDHLDELTDAQKLLDDVLFNVHMAVQSKMDS